MVQGNVVTGSCRTANRANAVKFEAVVKEKVFARIYLDNENKDFITVLDAVTRFMKDTQHGGVNANHKIFQRKVFGEKRIKGTQDTMQVYGLQEGVWIHEISERQIQELITARRDEGNSNATILQELVFINQMISHTKRLAYQTPTINFAELKKVNRLKPNRGAVRYLTADEETDLIKELCRVDDYVGTEESNLQRIDSMQFVVCLLDLGCRHGELAKLKISQLDMDKGLVHLWRPKVKNESVLVMTDRVRAILEDRLSVKHADQVYVFENKTGGHRNYAPRVLKSACVRAGLEGITFHKLRHTFASKLVQNNVSLYYVQQLLGHTNSSTTEIYAHLAPNLAAEQAVEIMNRLNVANKEVRV